ncbi:UDP-glucose 6-dehydrogenase TuaD [Geobacillus sp. BCO2]|nr:UDP-glucose 6-dehydrogenase TuaD [Geobacillus sp. BCO2]
MNICIIGAGYVGLTTAAVLAELGHDVHCIDHDERKIRLLNNGEIPFYEPGLEELIAKHHHDLTFSGRWDDIKRAAVVVICVGTPPRPDGSTDLRYIEAVLNRLATMIESYKTIVTKSTVPPGTNEWMRAELIRKGVKPQLFRIVSNPEFCAKGRLSTICFIQTKLSSDSNRMMTNRLPSCRRCMPASMPLTSQRASPARN